MTADLARSGAAWSLLVAPAGRDPLDPKVSYEISFDRGPGGLIVYVNGRPVRSERRDRPGHRVERSERPAHAERSNRSERVVLAPMPGRVVKMLVKKGDQVAERQAVVVLEAMKMENELRAPLAGTVSDVRVVEGALVDANAVLVIIE